MSDWAAARKVRKAIIAVAAVLETYDRRVSQDELVYVSAQTAPSVTGTFSFCLI